MDEHLAFPPFSDGKVSPKARLTALQKAEMARGAEIFSEATVEQLFQVAGVAREVDFAPRQIIFREGGPADAFYVIVDGEVELASLEKGLREVVGPGRAFGLYAVLAREPQRFTATALQGTFAITVEAEDIYGLISDSTELAASILRYFVRKCLNPYD
jgi:CRP-like cAMP-binding protein